MSWLTEKRRSPAKGGLEKDSRENQGSLRSTMCGCLYIFSICRNVKTVYDCVCI